MASNLKGPLYLGAAASIWGGMYVASKYALHTVPPFTLLFIRYALAAAALLGWCRIRRTAVIPREDRWLLFQIGFFGYFLSIAAQFIGTKLATAHMGAVITTLSPVFQSGFAIWLLRAKMNFRQSVAIGVSLAGVLVITCTNGVSRAETFNPGNLFFLAAACLWGYYSVLAKKAALRHTTLQITTWGILWAALLAIPPALSEVHSWNMARALSGWPVLLSILYIALLSTTIAFFCWNKGVALTNPHQAGLFFFLQPVVGSILGWLILGEVLSPSFFAGSLLILAGVYFVMQSESPGDTRALET